MNDFDYENLQKKRLARNAYHNSKYKRGGCHLPHEDLTPAQLKRRNGPMATYNLNAPMSWTDFKKMPHDLQQQYLDFLYTEFHAGQKDMAEHLFHLHQTYLCHALKELHLTTKVSRKCYTEKFQKWIDDGEWAQLKEEAEASPTHINHLTYYTEEQRQEAIAEEIAENTCAVNSLTVSFRNIHSWEELYAMVKGLPLTPDAVVEVSVR